LCICKNNINYHNHLHYIYFVIDGAELLPKSLESLESTMISSYKCYEKALSLEPIDIDKNNLLRRLGNIHNELGVFYMNQAGCV